MTTTQTFVAKVSRIRNRRSEGKDYYIYRLNIPSNVAKKLQLAGQEYLLLTVEKAEWYHLLDWSKMKPESFKRLPEDVKAKIKKAGLTPKEEAQPIQVST